MGPVGAEDVPEPFGLGFNTALTASPLEGGLQLRARQPRGPRSCHHPEDRAPLYAEVSADPVRRRLCFTPAYASWANPVEAHFGALRQFTIANSNHSNHTVQTKALHAYPRRRNANARHRDVLAAERKERTRLRSEKGIRCGGRPLKAIA
jgi:hypothetical protein